MNDKDQGNVFRFILKQNDVLICEKAFDADMYTPFTRYSINVRNILPATISKLQKALSRRNYNTDIEVGRVDATDDNSAELVYDLLGEYYSAIEGYPDCIKEELKYDPQPILQEFEGRTIRGVQFKLGLYLNNHPIVEREFYVDGFNPLSRYSGDIVDVVLETVRVISEQIRATDIKNIWDDYELIKQTGLSINQIRELLPHERKILISRLD